MKHRQAANAACPCGRPLPYAQCCGRYIARGELAGDAETLMRSRYSAYTLGEESYLLASWHPDTRPERLDLASEPRPKWLGLEVKGHACQDASHASVEFVARYKVAGRAFRMHELSRFVRESGIWYYLDGTQLE